MKCLNILMAAAALLACLGTAINGVMSQELAVPFNDLLPPLLEAAEASNVISEVATEITTATTTTTTPTTTATTTVTPATAATAAPAIKLSKAASAKKKSRYQEQTQHIKDLHIIDDDALVQRDYNQQLQKLAQPKQQKQLKLQQKALKQQQYQQPTQKLRLEQLQQYANYFQHTTARPPRGALPTLTPFPRHLK